MSFRQQVLSGLYWTGGARLAGQLLSWAITLVVIRLLSPADYGLIAMAMVFASFLTLLGEAGLGAALVQAPKVSAGALRGIFAAVILVDGALFCVQYAAAPAVAWFFEEERLIAIIRVLGAQLVLSIFSIIPRSLLMREMDFKRPSLIELGSNVCGSIVILVLVLTGHGVWSIVLGNIATQAFSTVAFNVVSPYLKWPDFSMRDARGLLTFGGQYMVSRMLWFFYSQADIFIAGKALGREALGFYSVAMHVASLPVQKISAVLNNVAFPAFAQAQQDREAVRQYLAKSVRLLSVVSFPVLWGISSVAPELVTVAFGAKWQPAVLPLQTLSLIMPLTLLSPFFNAAYQGLGFGGIVLRNVLTATVLMPIAFLVGIQWGLEGLALAWIIGFPAVFLVNLSRMLPLLGLTVWSIFASMAPALLSSAVMYGAVAGARELLASRLSDPVLMASLVVIGVAVYAIMAVSVNRKTLGEILELRPRRG